MKNIPIFVFLSLLAIGPVAVQGKTLTKEQINSLVESGNYPEQNEPVVKADQSAPFEQCKAIAQKALADVKGNYPGKVILGSSLIYSVKLWTNDGAVMITCTSENNRMKILQSTYKD